MSKESRRVLADQSRIYTTFGEPERQRRWRVLFRGVLIIPLLVVLIVRAIAVEFLVFIGWFFALFMGRLPARPASYIARNIRFATRVQAYGSLMLDGYPPFSLDDHDYQIEVSLSPGRVGRLSVLFRFILAIPAGIVSGLVTGGFTVAAVFIWLIVLIKGRMPRSLFEALAATWRYSARYQGYLFMVSSAYPGELFGDAVVLSAPWPSAEGGGLAYPPPSTPSGATALPTTLPTYPPEATSEQPAEIPTSPNSGGPRYDFSQQDEPRANAPFSATPPPSQWGFDAPVTTAQQQRVPFVLTTQAKRILVLFLLLGFVFNGVSRVLPLVVTHPPNNSTPQAEQVAEAIGFQATDFPPGTQADYRGAGSPENRSAPALCTPVSSQPWLANEFSGDFSLASNAAGSFAESTYSNVVIMPDAADAMSGLDAISAPGYAESCTKPADDAEVPSSYTGSKACGSLTLLNSTISPLPARNLGFPAVASRYTATMRCSLSGAEFPIYDDDVNVVVGAAFIYGDFSETNTTPTPAQEQHYMSAMTSRAPTDLANGNSGPLALRKGNTGLRRA